MNDLGVSGKPQFIVKFSGNEAEAFARHHASGSSSSLFTIVFRCPCKTQRWEICLFIRDQIARQTEIDDWNEKTIFNNTYFGNSIEIDIPYLTSGTVIELSAMFVARMILRIFRSVCCMATYAWIGAAVECKIIRSSCVSWLLQREWQVTRNDQILMVYKMPSTTYSNFHSSSRRCIIMISLMPGRNTKTVGFGPRLYSSIGLPDATHSMLSIRSNKQINLNAQEYCSSNIFGLPQSGFILLR